MLELTSEERERLTRWARRQSSAQALALRSRIVLGCADGLATRRSRPGQGVSAADGGQVAAPVRESRLDGLADEPRPGVAPSIAADQVEDVVVATLESTPKNATHWSRAKMASAAGCHRRRSGGSGRRSTSNPSARMGSSCPTTRCSWRRSSTSSACISNPPDGAVVLCVDEKSQVQALARSQPAFPMMPGMPEKRTHDYVRHGVDHPVRGVQHRRRHGDLLGPPPPPGYRVPQGSSPRSTLRSPTHLDVHLVCDNYGTHKHPPSAAWLTRHPRFHIHYTPTYSSWINQVERWFAYLTTDLLQRGDHRSVQALEADLRAWIRDWNEAPKPFIWTKTAEQILESLGRLMQRIKGAGH